MAANATQYNKHIVGTIRMSGAIKAIDSGSYPWFEDSTGQEIFSIQPGVAVVPIGSNLVLSYPSDDTSAYLGLSGGNVITGPKQYIALVTVTGSTAPNVSVSVKTNTLNFTPTFNPISTGNWQILGPSGGFPQTNRTVEWGMLNDADGVNGSIVQSDVFFSDSAIEFYTRDNGNINATGMTNVMLKITVYP